MWWPPQMSPLIHFGSQTGLRNNDLYQSDSFYTGQYSVNILNADEQSENHGQKWTPTKGHYDG